MIVQCKRCHREFHATKSLRVYCSRECKERDCAKVDLVKLAELVSLGDKCEYMAAVFGVAKPTIWRLLRTHGLYSQWREIRNT